ncbi:N,N-dimethylformamidase beta subunit family domain-containing protein [Paenibacillus sp. 481]|uniref:N,N-dimethylformamidase beta subunit family domain-containing protein n=1 Tax=Paenibacillus sp. 481 TaxID=2835869 RepID=UPI001E4F2A43|nr:N,N-dimethylformamidase beta subunit family domain-containing protein [Paenibacillus sp. 481]UHA73997.1 N,N-dimethylformamidase [Paenibacillus sp. 481]
MKQNQHDTANSANTTGQERLTIVGYADHWSVQPGQELNFKIDTTSSMYTASVVRICGGLTDPDHSLDLPTAPVDADCAGEYRGRRQPTIVTGSYAELPLPSTWLQGGEFSAQLWIMPTIQTYNRPQTVLSARSAAGAAGVELVQDENAYLTLSITDGCGQSVQVRTATPLEAKSWYFIALQYSARSGKATLFASRHNGWLPKNDTQVHTEAAQLNLADVVLSRVLLAADSQADGTVRPFSHYNGKIGNPRFSHAVYDHVQLQELANGTDDVCDDSALVADYDFSDGISSTRLKDRSENGHHGTLHQGGTRGVTSHNWTGEVTDHRYAPEQYAAVHFNDNDLVDAGWETDITWRLPADLASGVYALKLEAGDKIDYIAFFVRPAKDGATAPVLFLAPTLNYMAYANEWLFKYAKDYMGEDYVLPEQDVYLEEHPELGKSIYDLNSDGSGVQYSSRLRPVMNMRPHYRNWRTIRHFSADLYITGWLEQRGHSHDVATDEDLHHEGIDFLRPYKVIITGSHPEYWTRPMMKALEQYLATGGRVMYLGGNGFYWVTSVDPERPHLLEVRRGNAGTRSSDSPPGELHLSTTGEPGGLWRHHGYVPQQLLGVGTTAIGGGMACSYKRMPDSFKPEASFVFEGIGEDEAIGDFGFAAGGAAGDELDRYDLKLGTPRHTLWLASATGFDDNYQFVHEELLNTAPNQGGTQNPLVRADMTYFDIDGGGAVFSVGSMNWAGSLAWNGYDNNVVRVSDNVLKHLLAERNSPVTASAEGV